MFNERNDKKISIAVFLVIILIGCIGLFIKHQSPLLASGPLDDLKVNIIVIKEKAGNLSEKDIMNPLFHEHLRLSVIHKYKDEIYRCYSDEINHPPELLHSEVWLDSLGTDYYAVVRYDFTDNIRALSLIDIQNDSLITINAFRKGSMVPYTFGPLAKKARVLIWKDNIRI